MTLKEKVLEYLKTHKYLTVLDGIKELGTTELRHYIAQLRRDGYEIGDEFVKQRKTGQPYKRYFLVRKGAK